jgi:cytochrome c-type biogenesis protein CcmE
MSVNKRAQTRLIGVTAIILIAVAAIFFGLGGQQAAYYKSVKEIASDDALKGERVKVGGAVVAGSWDKKSNPMTFTIRDEADAAEKGPVVKVVYNGMVPSTFGDGVTAIVTGELAADGTVDADEMITKCPSKYESASGAMPIQDLIGKGESMVGTTVRATGVVKAGTIVAPGGTTRFVVVSTTGGGEEIGVGYEGALPSGMTDGSKVVMTGAIESDGTFVATNVALDQADK